MAVVLGRSRCFSRNDPSEVRSSSTGRLCLEDGPPDGLGISKGAHQGRREVG